MIRKIPNNVFTFCPSAKNDHYKERWLEKAQKYQCNLKMKNTVFAGNL